MGWVLIFVIAALAVFILYGWHMGFMKMLIHLLALFIALLVASIVGPMVADFAIGNEKIMTGCEEKVYDSLGLSKLAAVETATKEQLEALKLPEAVTEKLGEYADKTNYKENYETLGVSNAADYIAKSVAMMIIRSACYVIVFILALIILAVIANMTDIVFHFLGVQSINKALGAVAGLIEAAVVIWLVFTVVTAFSNTAFGSGALTQISENAFLSWIYDNNPISMSVTNISKFFR